MLRIPDATMLQMAPAEMDWFLFLDDFDNSRTFLLKLYKYYTASLQRSIRNKNTENEPLFFDDLDDEVVFNITSYWGKKAMERERPSKPPVVFLSYNRNNQSMAYHIQRELEKKGVFTWKAPADVPIGDDYYVHEMAAIKACEAFIILLSPSSQESNEVKIEFEAAIQNKKKIFPIKLWEFEVNEYYMTALKRIEWRILEGCDYSFLDEIVKYIKG